MRGDGGSVMSRPPPRLEARRRLGCPTANELGAPVVSSIPEQLPRHEPASARKGYEDGTAFLFGIDVAKDRLEAQSRGSGRHRRSAPTAMSPMVQGRSPLGGDRRSACARTSMSAPDRPPPRCWIWSMIRIAADQSLPERRGVMNRFFADLRTATRIERENPAENSDFRLQH